MSNGNVLITPRRQLPWKEYGQAIAQPMMARQNVYNELMPLLFKAQLEKQLETEQIRQVMGGGQGAGGYSLEDVKIGPFSFKRPRTQPEIQQEADIEATKRTAAKTAEANIARKIYSKDLDNFLAVDDVLQKVRGTGEGRFQAGINMTIQGITQKTPLGRAVAQHDAAVKRLRVQLVRAAGDVGNLNIVEQKAAEKLIPTKFDDAGTATLKRTYLKELTKAIDNNDESGVRNLVNNWQETEITKQESSIPSQVPKIGGIDKRTLYNQYREQGLSSQRARQKAGL